MRPRTTPLRRRSRSGRTRPAIPSTSPSTARPTSPPRSSRRLSSNSPPDIAYADTNDFADRTAAGVERHTSPTSSDVVDTVKDKYTKTALLSAYLYNNVAEEAELLCDPAEAAGAARFLLAPAARAGRLQGWPISRQTWDDFWKFWGTVQDKLRDQGRCESMPSACRCRRSTPTTTTRSTNTCWPMAVEIVKPDGPLNLTDQTQRRRSRLLTFLTDAFKDGYVPPSARQLGRCRTTMSRSSPSRSS